MDYSSSFFPFSPSPTSEKTPAAAEQMSAVEALCMQQVSLFHSQDEPVFDLLTMRELDLSPTISTPTTLTTQQPATRYINSRTEASFPATSFTDLTTNLSQVPFGDLHHETELTNLDQYFQEHIEDTNGEFSASSLQNFVDRYEDHQLPFHGENLAMVKAVPSERESNGVHHDDDEFDKPYAFHIWEALMKAPNHRMMLRDIYDYFLMYTTKPEESGTKGWQNSIRHNLSMNQAFTNEKTHSNGKYGTSKATSMWILTDHAIKYGVQSTTRYRKVGKPKKGELNKVPAIRRQQSGAKGGRAARRAARLRRQTGRQLASSKIYPLRKFEPSQPQVTSTDKWAKTSTQSFGFEPKTPANDEPLGYSHALTEYCVTDCCRNSKLRVDSDWPFEDMHKLDWLLSNISSHDLLLDEVFGQQIV